MKKMLLAALAVAASASALSAAEPRSPLAKDQVVLDLRHLDLTSVQGQRLLAIRMDQAERAVCGDRLSTIHLDLEARSRECRADVAADLRARIEARSAGAGGAEAAAPLAFR